MINKAFYNADETLEKLGYNTKGTDQSHYEQCGSCKAGIDMMDGMHAQFLNKIGKTVYLCNSCYVKEKTNGYKNFRPK